MDPVEAASLAADPSFNSHIDHFDSRDDEFTSGNKINDDITAMQQSVFDALPLTVVHVLQPAAQPQNGLNVFLQSSVPTLPVSIDWHFLAPPMIYFDFTALNSISTRLHMQLKNTNHIDEYP